MGTRIVNAAVYLKSESVEGSEDCYQLCLFLTDTMRLVDVDYMINVDEGVLNCYLHPNDYGEFKLLALLDEMFGNDLAVARYDLSIVNAETI